MVREPNISFIPKKPLAKEPGAEKRPISLFAMVAFVILVLTVGAYGGVLYYAKLVQDNIVEKQRQLETFNEEFDKTIIQEAKSLENRIDAVEGILSRHRTLSPVFALLERITLQSVQFTTFDYTEEEGSLVLTLSGIAPGFASLAYQRDVFLEEVDALSSFEITEFNLEQTGSVAFRAKAVVSPDTVRYDKKEETSEGFENVLPETETSTSTDEAISS